jgi:hypothetical protein
VPKPIVGSSIAAACSDRASRRAIATDFGAQRGDLLAELLLLELEVLLDELEVPASAQERDAIA